MKLVIKSTNHLLKIVMETIVQGYICIIHALKRIIHTKRFMDKNQLLTEYCIRDCLPSVIIAIM